MTTQVAEGRPATRQRPAPGPGAGLGAQVPGDPRRTTAASPALTRDASPPALNARAVAFLRLYDYVVGGH